MITGSNGRMEVPPGRLLLQSSGGKDALARALPDAANPRLIGVLRPERVRDDEPARGFLVFKDGNGTLAAHSWRDDLDGPLAIPAIVRDALEDDALLELRSYDHRASAVRPDQLESSHPSAHIDGLPPVTRILAEIEAQERAEREHALAAGARKDAGGSTLEEGRAELRAVREGS